MTSLISLLLAIALQQTPEQVVQKQLDTYNARDIEGFMTVMSRDVQLFEYGQPSPTAQGADAIRRLYAQLFQNSPQLHSNLINRMVIGNKVIDHESIVGRNGNPAAIELIVIYKVNETMKIDRITVIRP